MRRLRHALGPIALIATWALPLHAQPQADHGADGGDPPTGRPIVLHADGSWTLLTEREAADQEARLTDSAIDALRDGRVADARDLLGEILVERQRRQAEELLAAGEPADALNAIDRALDIEPNDESVLELRARGLLALGERMISDGAGGVFVDGAFNDALKAFRGLGRTATGRLGAARAAYMLNRSDDALRYAREATALLDGAEADGAGADRATAARPSFLHPQRVVADAVYLAYADAARLAMTGDPAARAAEDELFPEAENALDDLIATVPQEADTWQLAANLYLFRSSAREDVQARLDARDLLETGLEYVPEDRDLLARAAEVARTDSPAESVALLERYQASNPGSMLAHRFLGIERFELAMAEFPGPDADPALCALAVERFEAAETEFRTVREAGASGAMDPGEAISWEIICRNARGWVRFNEGDLEGARAAFLSTEELNPRGLEWDYAARGLYSGIRGLEFVVAAHVESEELVQAAEVADILHARLPDDADMANNAGFLNRDAATALANMGERYCRAAKGEIDDPDMVARIVATLESTEGLTPEQIDDLLVAKSREYAARARATMVRSSEAYRDAARLSPDDVRIINDTALVFVYYLHSDLEFAEGLLMRAVALGEEQLAAGGLDEQQLYELKNAWGDAHENLGVLWLEHRQDLDQAEAWFRGAAEIGPDPRPIVDEYWLATISARRAGAPAEPSPVLAWVRDCE
ncbi:hypothetical protein [Engelhardtia mirabilis]|uniref:Tetratricopeptide repeat protein n=1 Tax=Engelhardtia mirabilis TaxID=2528011 RepID=A0A518BPV4_9BACT|nr:Tetratricopeptide repeat protein [Planctomycetes bacterium Pla133]QDV03335.1 Tetratricopeptide repeat protein [Planctomycetes bacterium Pla86]